MTVFLVAVFVLLGGVLLIDRLPPSIPGSAATTPVARAAIDDVASGGFAEDCFDTLSRGSAWAHLCWQISREPQEADSEKDYYLLHMYGSFQGFRWLVVRSDFDGVPAGQVFDAWPTSVYEGQCMDEPVHLMPFLQDLTTETLCGRTEGRSDHSSWTHQVTWTCERCLLRDEGTRAVSLFNEVGVPQGALPAWDLFADGGT